MCRGRRNREPSLLCAGKLCLSLGSWISLFLDNHAPRGGDRRASHPQDCRRNYALTETGIIDLIRKRSDMARRNSVEIVERFWREVWQSKNLNAIDDLVIEDFSITSSGVQIETRDAFKKWVAAFLSSINDAGGCLTPYDNRPRAPVVEACQAANDRASSKATITLADDLTVNTVTEASIDNIKEGDFVGIANVPDGGGTSSALEVVAMLSKPRQSDGIN